MERLRIDEYFSSLFAQARKFENSSKQTKIPNGTEPRGIAPEHEVSPLKLTQVELRLEVRLSVSHSTFGSAIGSKLFYKALH